MTLQRKTKVSYLFFFVVFLYIVVPSCLHAASSTSNLRVSIVGDQCLDGIDNDRDGFVDFPADLDCESIIGQSEGIPVEPPPPPVEEEGREPRRHDGGNSVTVVPNVANPEAQSIEIINTLFGITTNISTTINEIVGASTGTSGEDTQPFRGRTIVTQGEQDLFDVRIDPIIFENIGDAMSNEKSIQVLMTTFYLLLGIRILIYLKNIVMLIS